MEELVPPRPINHGLKPDFKIRVPFVRSDDPRVQEQTGSDRLADAVEPTIPASSETMDVEQQGLNPAQGEADEVLHRAPAEGDDAVLADPYAFAPWQYDDPPSVDPSHQSGSEPADTTLTLPGASPFLLRSSSRSKSPVAVLSRLQPLSWDPTVPQPRSISRLWFPALTLLGGLMLGALVGYFASQSGTAARSQAASKKAASVQVNLPAVNSERPTPEPLTPHDYDELDDAYTAWSAGKYNEAFEAFSVLQRKHSAWDFMEIEKGRVRTYQQDLPGAYASLLAAADRGSRPADAYFDLGLLFTIKRDYAAAETNFAKAVTDDPTRPDIFYFWGECLRLQGKALQATQKFRSALLRNFYETADDLYRLKLWLSEIESGQEETDGITPQLRAALALPRPPMEALFAQAVLDLKRGQIQQAVNRLRQARQAVEPKVFLVVMSDPAFLQEQWRPELAEFFPARPAAPASSPGDAATFPGVPTALSEPGMSPAPSESH